MTLPDTVAVISSVVAAIGVILSLLLWLTMVRSLKQIRRQNDNLTRSIRNDAIHRITLSHQNIFLSILSDAKLRSSLAKGLSSPRKFQQQMIGTLLINHCAAVHEYAVQQSLDPDDWLGMQNDIVDLFSWPVVRERWPQIRAFYSRDFQGFIDTLVVKGRRVVGEVELD